MIIDNPMVQLLLDNGYTDGWAMTEETLTIWEHDEDPPAPLTRPAVTVVAEPSVTDAG